MPLMMSHFLVCLFVFLSRMIAVMRLKEKANNPPMKLGSNQVESSRPWCGSQPRTSKVPKSGLIFN